MTTKIEVVASAVHKNGKGGKPYTVAIFDDPAESDTRSSRPSKQFSPRNPRFHLPGVSSF